ncbi:hypothetical protein B0I35DRAFT_48727 [Stachybotrys elegans]|uniref:SET domain-containing protein n=1 Tax=Stachybotrys elegans TaxID=80388 RepID=A0A8K0T0Z5_9HYPO|nr:hypothetical protein B0I35DRAFT_48727 [Stachybotrys elegans]
MGFDCGFDIHPRLEPTAANKDQYQRFLDEIIREYGDIYDERGRRADGKVLSTPGDAGASDRLHIRFMVGECPQLPSHPNGCYYFLRFSSKISGSLTSPAEPYIKGVYKTAKKYLGSRVHFWHEMSETGDERQFGYYDWQTVYDAEKELGKLTYPADERSGTSSLLDADAGRSSNSTQCLDLKQDSSSSQPATSSQLASKNGKAYAIMPVPSKGQGVIATRKIHKGTRIISEAPMFKVPRDEPSIQAVDDAIIRALKSLDRDDQRAFFSLCNAYGKAHSPFLGIARTNVLPLGSEAREGGLFLEASRVNHSCRHNAQNTWNASIGRLTIHALCDIEEGQEITISYLARRMEHSERQGFLKAKFLFDCSCDLCMLPPAQRQESDLRLRSIQSIDDTIGTGVASTPNTGLHLVRAMLRLLEEEGIWDAGVPRAYYDAFQIAVMDGDEARAKIFAERAYAARVVIEGDDSPTAARLRKLAERPSQHPLYQVRKDSPQEIDGLEFDDWLWRETNGQSDRSS